MPKTSNIELPGLVRIPIVFENRTVLIVDKPAGWVLGPDGPIGRRGNLQVAVESSINHGAYWARSRSLKFLRFVHRLDADTTGLLLFSKSFGGLEPLSELFAERKVEKRYLAVVEGVPDECHWTCTLPLGPDQEHNGRHRVDKEHGRESETRFEVLASIPGRTLISCEPLTGRSHQIRIHLAEAGHPVVGDPLYGRGYWGEPLGLRSIYLAFRDPYLKTRVHVVAPVAEFLQQFGFEKNAAEPVLIALAKLAEAAKSAKPPPTTPVVTEPASEPAPEPAAAKPGSKTKPKRVRRFTPPV